MNNKKVKQTIIIVCFLTALIIISSTKSWGQLLVQDFNFTGTLTANSWVAHSGSGTNPISTTTGLTYAGHQGSGVGNAALLGNAGGEDDNITFANQNAPDQSVYFSCLVRITDAAATKTGDYFMHLGTPGGSTFTLFAARVFAKITSSNVNFGISNTSTATYGTTNFAKNTTYLLVVKYVITVGGNDPVSLWVIPTGIPATEVLAGTPEISSTTTAGQDAINTIALRQGSNTTSPQTVVDAIRVGLTWESVTPLAVPNLSISGVQNHGTLCQGNAGSSIQYTINNSGATAAGIAIASSDGQFAVSNIPATVPAGGTANFNVIFTPLAGGAQSSTITVTSTTSGSNSPTINLIGIGQAPVSPVVSSLSATAILTSSAVINGDLLTLGVCPSTTQKGFVYSLTTANSDPFVDSAGVTKSVVAGVTTGSFFLQLLSLPPNTSYSYKAYVYDGSTYTYGAVTTFTTDPPPSAVVSVTGSLSSVNTTYGTASNPVTSFGVSGTNLTADILIVAPYGFEMSSGGSYNDSLLLTQTMGSVGNTTIDVRLSDTTDVGTYSGNITLTSAGSNNPLLPTVASVVSPKPLSVSGAVAQNKVYDGNTSALIDVSNATLAVLVNNDVVTVSGGGNFNDSNAGVGKSVTTNLLLGGADAGNYTLNQPSGLTANILQAGQTITFGVLPVKTFGNAPFKLLATASSGLVVSYQSSNPLVATISNDTVFIVGTGTSTITSLQSGNINYNAAINVPQTLTVNQANQTITFSTLPNKTIADVPFSLTATASSNLTVSYMSSNTSVATVVGNIVTIQGVGTTTITASQSGNANFLAATDVARTLTVTYTVIAAWQFGTPQAVGDEVTYNATTNHTNINSVTLSRGSGILPTSLSRGFSSNNFSASPNTKANAIATNQFYQFTINPKNNYITSLNTLYARLRRTSAGANAYIWRYSTDGTNFFDIGTDVNYTSTADGVDQAQINLAAVQALQRIENITSVTFRLYAWGATSLSGTFAVGRYGSGITTNSLAVDGTVDSIMAPVINSVLTAAGTTGVPFNYTITATNIPTSFSSTVLPPGLVLNTYSGAITGNPTTVGPGTYNVDITVNNSAGTDTKTLVITIAKGNQTISFAALTPKTYGNAPFNLTATASSGLAITYVSSDTTVAKVTGNTVTIIGGGNTNITASQTGNADFNAAADVTQNLVVNKANQTIAFGPLANKLTTDPASVLGATASSGLIISYQSSNPLVAVVSNDTLYITGPGTTTITASQPGNNNFNAAANVSQSLLVTDPFAPVLSATTLTDFGEVCLDTTAGPNTFTIAGLNLSTDSIVVGPLSGFSFSLNDTTYSDSLVITQSGGSFSQLVYVKFRPVAVQSYNGNILIKGGSAPQINVFAYGIGINTPASVITESAISVTQLSATLPATVASIGCTPISTYGFEYSLTNGFINGSGTQVASNNLSGSAFSVTLGALIPNTPYYYKAYVINAGGTSYGTQQSFTTLTVGAPVALTATNIDSTSFRAYWNVVGGATSYKLDVSTSNTFFEPVNPILAGWSFPVNGTNVTADNANTNNTAKTLTTNGGSIADATGASTRAPSTSSWQSGSGSKNWQIEINTTGFFNLKLSSAQRSSGTGPRNFKVQYKIGSGPFADVLGGAVLVANDFTSGVLTNLSLPAACDNQTSVTIRWIMTSNTNVNGDVNGVASGGTSRIDNILVSSAIPSFVGIYNDLTVNDTSLSVVGLSPNTVYYYRVRAVSIAGTTGNSNTISARTCTNAILSKSYIEPSCNGNGNDASATVNATSGTLPYGYLWSNGQTTATATGLSGGKYFITVTSNTGCPVKDSVVVVAPAPASPKIIPGNMLLCSGQNIYLHVIDTGAYSGGYPLGTTVDWVNIVQGLSPNDSVNSSGIADFTAVVHIPSQNNCTYTSPTVNIGTHQLNVLPVISSSTCGISNGKILVNVIGTPPFRYEWSDGTNLIRDLTTPNTSDSITGLLGGFYKLTVTDNYGNLNPGLSCSTGQLTYFVPSNGGPVATISAHSDVRCKDETNGSATVIQTGGIGTITYEWFPYGGTAYYTEVLGAGDFYVLVTDANGCADTAQVTINEPDSLLTTISSVMASCGNSDGTAIATVTGGRMPYLYVWYDAAFETVGTDNDTVTGLMAGTYYSVVSDLGGQCQSVAVFNITEICDAVLDLTVYIEGYDIGLGMQPVLFNSAQALGNTYPNTTDCDTIIVELRNPSDLATVVESKIAVLQVDGTANVTYPGAISGGDYYIVVRNRTSVETWSALPVTFSELTNYNFSDSASRAFGNNQKESVLSPGIWVMYSGDIDDGSSTPLQDGFVDAFDFLLMDVDIQGGVSGYYVTDINGDGFVDAFDFLVLDPNIQLGISRLTPP